MKPLFTWYHLQSDELLGSWLFFFAAVPIIPYSFIYLIGSYTNLVYLVALGVSCVLVFGTYLFVRACYPIDKPRRKIIQPLARCLCCCFCSRRWLNKHLSNDWLAGTWFIFWATLFACFACFVLFIAAIAESKGLLIFVWGTGFLENLIFLLGSAYFVAGSYPEVIAGDDGDGEGDGSVQERDPESASAAVAYNSSNPIRSDGKQDGLTTPFIARNDDTGGY